MTEPRSRPEPIAEAEGAFDALVYEVSAKLEAGEAVDMDAIAAEHPEHVDRLARLLPTLQAMAELGHSDTAFLAAPVESPGPAEVKTGVLGDYRILREIGRGGMGVVYEAEQVSLGRKVALKVLPFAAVLDPKHLKRFQNEARAAASLRHPNIVQVHSVGCERAVHFYAMDYVEGQTLAEVIRDLRRIEGVDEEGEGGRRKAEGGKPDEQVDAGLADSLASGKFARLKAGSDPNAPTAAYQKEPTPQDRAPGTGVAGVDGHRREAVVGEPPETDIQHEPPESETKREPQAAVSTECSTKSPAYFRSIAEIGVQVARALDHAHEQGVIHRDVKPSNVILDVEGKAWVTDFGLARIETDATLTISGDLLGTVRYMSPEQALAKRIVVDHRTDVYSLGVTLYELLTLQPAFTGQDRQELLRQIAFEEPRQPRRLNKSVPAELETIVLKAMAKNPTDRYDTALDLADDLERFLEDRPIRAKRPSLMARAAKWSRRHRAVVTSGAITATLVLLSVAIGALLVARKERVIAQNQSRIAEQERTARDAAEEAKDREAALREQAEEATKQGLKRLDQLYVAHGAKHMDEGDLAASLLWYTDALRLAQGDPPREQAHCVRIAAVLAQCPKPTQMWFHDGPVYCAEFSPDGQRVATASRDMTARVWDAATGRPVTPPLRHSRSVASVGFCPDGQRVVTASSDKTARVWDAATGKPITAPLQHSGSVRHASFSPDGSLVVTASRDGTAGLWDSKTGEKVREFTHGGGVAWASFSPDGRHVAIGGANETAQVRDATTGELIMETFGHTGDIQRVLFSSDGSRLFTADNNALLKIWDVASGERLAWAGHSHQIRHLSRTADSTRLVTASEDGTARVWDAATAEPITRPLEHGHTVIHASFTPDGRRVVTASFDGTARVWDTNTGELVYPPLRHGGPVRYASFAADGHRVVTASFDHTARLWDLASTVPTTPILEHGWGLTQAAFSPDGRFALTASVDRTARVWDADTGEPVTASLGHDHWVNYAEFSPDGRRIVTASGNAHVDVPGTARVWDALTGDPVTLPLKHALRVNHASFSPDGGRLITGTGRQGQVDGQSRVWNALTGEPLTPPLLQEAMVEHVCFSPNGRLVATAGGGPYDRKGSGIRLWEADTGRQLWCVRTRSVRHLSFSADGQRLVAATGDRSLGVAEGEAHIWDVTTGQPVGQPLSHQGIVRLAAFSPDGYRVVTASEDRTARVWSAATGDPTTPPLRHEYMVLHASFSPDSHFVVTASSDGTLRVWDATTGEPVTATLRQPKGLTYRRYYGNFYVKQLFGVASFGPDGRRVIGAAGVNTTAAIWKLEPIEWPVDDLLLIAQLYAGHRLYATGGMLALTPSELRVAWETLHAEHPRDFTVSSDQVLAWERRELSERIQRRYAATESRVNYSKTGDALPDYRLVWREHNQVYSQHESWQEVIDDYSKVLELMPDSDLTWAKLAEVRCSLGQWDKAAHDLAKASELDSENAYLWYKHALALLGAGDAEGYFDACRRMQERFRDTDDATTAHWVAWTSVLGPDVAADPGLPVELAEIALQAEPESFQHLGTHGAALYRVGRFDEAIRQLSKADELVPTPDPSLLSSPAYSWCFLAMAHHRQGDAEEARKWLDKAVQWTDTVLREHDDGTGAKLAWNRRLTLQLLRAEAESLDERDEQAAAAHTKAIEQHQDDPARWFRRARFYANRDQTEKASADFAKVVELDPQDPQLLEEMGHFCLHAGDLEQAISLYDKAIDLLPDDPQLRICRGEVFEKLEQWDRALADFSKAIELSPEDWPAWVKRAKPYEESGRWDEAIAVYSLIIKTSPEEPEPWKRRGEAHLHLERWDEAVEDLRKAIALSPDDWEQWLGQVNKECEELGRWDEGIALYSTLIELRPERAEPWIQRAQAYEQSKQWDKAAADFRKASELRPQDVTILKHLAEVYASWEKRDTAFALFSKIIEIAPDYAEPWSDRAQIHLQRGDYDKAIADSNEAIRLKPDKSSPYRWRGKAYLEMGEFEKAFADFDQAIRVAPTSFWEYNARAAAHLKMENYDKAAQDYSEVIKLKPDDPQAWLDRAELHVQMKQWEQAIADCEEALRLDPQSRKAIDLQNQAYKAMGEEAIPLLSKRIEAEPDDARLRMRRAEVYVELNEWDRAIADLTAAIDLNPGKSEAYRARCEAYFQMDDLDNAVADYNQYAEIGSQGVEYAKLTRDALEQARKHPLATGESPLSPRTAKVSEVGDDDEFVWFDAPEFGRTIKLGQYQSTQTPSVNFLAFGFARVRGRLQPGLVLHSHPDGSALHSEWELSLPRGTRLNMQWALEDRSTERTRDGLKFTVIAYDEGGNEHVILDQVMHPKDTKVYQRQWQFEYEVKRLRFVNDTLDTEWYDRLWCLPEIVLPE